MAVGDDGARHRFAGLADQIVMHRQPVHLRHGARMNGQRVERVLGKDGQQRVELAYVTEAHASFDGELDADRFAQRSEDGINPLRLAQQATARALAIHDGRGAAEVQVNRGDVKLLKFLRRADERGDVVADHLRDDGPARGVLFDGIENPFLRARHGVDAEVFRPINIRAAVAVHEIPKRAVRHVLHRGERQERRGAFQERIKLLVMIHDWGGEGRAMSLSVIHATANVITAPMSVNHGQKTLCASTFPSTVTSQEI